MSRLRRILPLLPLAFFLAAWGYSYVRSTIVLVRGYGGAFERGTFYFGGPYTFGTETKADLYPIDPRLATMFGRPLQRLTPVRHLTSVAISVWMVEAWALALVVAVPTKWVMMRQRRRAETSAGFEVAVAPKDGKA